MNTQAGKRGKMPNLILLRKALTVCALIGLMMWAFVGKQTAQAAPDIRPQTGMPDFGMFGVTTEQTARLNVSLDRPSSDTVPPDPYRVTLYFLNGKGNVLTQESFMLRAGQAAFLDHAAPSMRHGVREIIRPVVIIDPKFRTIIDPNYKPGFRSVVEVLNHDNQPNVFVYPALHSPPSETVLHSPPSEIVLHSPPSEYDSGIVGITRGQVARLNVVNTSDIYRPAGVPPDPCRVTLSFYTSEGILLAQVTRALAPGQAASLDVNANDFLSNRGVRLQLHAVVTVVPGTSGIAPCVMPTVEGIDLNDGQTSFLLPAV